MLLVTADLSKPFNLQAACKAYRLFAAFLKYKPHKQKLHADLDWQNMALGERVCLNLAYLLSDSTNDIDVLPALSLLDSELRKGVIEYLNSK